MRSQVKSVGAGMAVAFVVSAYRSPRLLARLVAALDGRPCALHVDAKVDVAPFAAALAGRGTVALLPRHVCHWGLFGHVAASLEGAPDSIESSATTSDFSDEPGT